MPQRKQTDSEARRDIVLAIDAWRRGDKRGTAHLIGQLEDKTLAVGTLVVLCADLLNTCNNLSKSKKAGDDLIAAWKVREQGEPDDDDARAAVRVDARTFLQGQLADGKPQKVTVLRARALSEGLTWEMLRGAAVRLGVIARPNGPGNLPHRTWQLPRSKVSR